MNFQILRHIFHTFLNFHAKKAQFCPLCDDFKYIDNQNSTLDWRWALLVLYLLFWNHILIWFSVKFKLAANLALSSLDRYLWILNLRSSSKSCWWLNEALDLRCFFWTSLGWWWSMMLPKRLSSKDCCWETWTPFGHTWSSIVRVSSTFKSSISSWLTKERSSSDLLLGILMSQTFGGTSGTLLAIEIASCKTKRTCRS